MKKYLFFGLGLLLLGAVLGAGGAYWQMKNLTPTALEPSAETSTSGNAGSDLSLDPSPSPGEGKLLSPGDGERPGERSKVSGEATTAAAPKPEIKPEVKAAVKVNPCESAKKDLAAALAAAQKAKEDSLAAAEKAFDAEIAEVTAKFADLATARSQAVNDYLTAIALATSKYNSSKAASAYAIYQTDQAAALDGYTKKIAEITAAEGPLQKAKKDAEEKYAAGGASADIKFISDKNAAEGAYAAKGCG